MAPEPPPLPPVPPLPPLLERFGIRSGAQLARDLKTVLSHLPKRDRYTFDLASSSLLRPDLSLPAYAGRTPADGIAPIFNFYDRHGGGRGFRATVTRKTATDYRGGRLSYDEHDGTDFVCPPMTPLAAAAPGIVVATRDRWLRGGLTLCIDHGHGVVTQYTHLMRVLVEPGQPVRRGEAVALSGFSGFDMTQFFPWVPPHVHFMVWVNGQPVDPYLADGEAARPGTWAHGNDPVPSGPLREDLSPEVAATPLDERALEAAIGRCLDEEIRQEIAALPTAAARAAILEDSLHHDRPAWPADAPGRCAWRSGDPGLVKLTLPLPAAGYRAARAADAPWTRPRRVA
jgi:murein DD-endopeptidase MepM/ murein hydrolase activator NlpD